VIIHARLSSLIAVSSIVVMNWGARSMCRSLYGKAQVIGKPGATQALNLGFGRGAGVLRAVMPAVRHKGGLTGVHNGLQGKPRQNIGIFAQPLEKAE